MIDAEIIGLLKRSSLFEYHLNECCEHIFRLRREISSESLDLNNVNLIVSIFEDYVFMKSPEDYDNKQIAFFYAKPGSLISSHYLEGYLDSEVVIDDLSSNLPKEDFAEMILYFPLLFGREND